MSVWTKEFSVTLTGTWVKVLDKNIMRKVLNMAPSTVFYDAYWTTNAALDGTSTAGGFPLLAGEDFGLLPGAAPKDAIYMRSTLGEVVTIREGN